MSALARRTALAIWITVPFRSTSLASLRWWFGNNISQIVKPSSNRDFQLITKSHCIQIYLTAFLVEKESIVNHLLHIGFKHVYRCVILLIYLLVNHAQIYGV